MAYSISKYYDPFPFYVAAEFGSRASMDPLELVQGNNYVTLTTKYLPPSYDPWRRNHAYSEGDKVSGFTDNGHHYTCIQGGTSGHLPPDFPTEKGAQFEDGSVVWKESGGAMAGYTNIAFPSNYELPDGDGYTKGGQEAPAGSTVNEGTLDEPLITMEPVTFSDINVENANYAFVSNSDGEVIGYVQLGEAGEGVPLNLMDLEIGVAQNAALTEMRIDRCRVKRTTLNPSPILRNTMSRYCFPQQGKHHYKGDQPELGVWNPDHPVTQPNCLCTFVDTGPPVIVDGPDHITQSGYYEYTAKCGPPPHSWTLSGPEGIDVSQWIQIVAQQYVAESDLMDPETPEHLCVIYADDPEHVKFTLTVTDGDGAQDSINVNAYDFALRVIRDDGATLSPDSHQLSVTVLRASDMEPYIYSGVSQSYFDEATGYFVLVPNEEDEPDPFDEYFIEATAVGMPLTVYPRQFGRQTGGSTSHMYRDQDKVQPGLYTMHVPYWAATVQDDPEPYPGPNYPPSEHQYAKYTPDDPDTFEHWIKTNAARAITVFSSTPYTLTFVTYSRFAYIYYSGNRPSDGEFMFDSHEPQDPFITLTVDGITGEWSAGHLGFPGVDIGDPLLVAPAFNYNFYSHSIQGVTHNATFTYTGPETGTLWDKGQEPWVEFEGNYETTRIVATDDYERSSLGIWYQVHPLWIPGISDQPPG